MSAKNSNDKNIRMSLKHGLNPTIPLCFWCREPKNEVALLGEIELNGVKDAEAPKHMILDYEPCECCAEKWSQCVVVVEISENPVSVGQPGIRISDNGKEKIAYPTGRYVGITLEAARNTFMGVDIELGTRLTVESALFERLFQGLIGKNADAGNTADDDNGLLQ